MLMRQAGDLAAEKIFPAHSENTEELQTNKFNNNMRWVISKQLTESYFDYFMSNADDESVKIIKKISDHLKISIDTIFQKTRKPTSAHARFLFMYIRYFHGSWITLKKIAQMFNLDHSSIIHWINNIKNELLIREKLLSKDPKKEITDPCVAFILQKKYLHEDIAPSQNNL